MKDDGIAETPVGLANPLAGMFGQHRRLPPALHPWHLTTREFFQQVSDKMNPRGVLVLNIVRVGSNRSLVDALAATLRQVFPSVLISDIPGMFNTIVFASCQQTSAVEVAQNTACLSAHSGTPAVITDVLTTTLINLQPLPADGLVLTDDRAPVEWLTTRMLLDFILSGKTRELQ